MIRKILFNNKKKFLTIRLVRQLSANSNKDHYKLLIVGGGSGGISTGAKFVRKLGPQNVAIIDPSKYHYYQPGWTLVGGGIENAESMQRLEKEMIPENIDFFDLKALKFNPEQNNIELENGKIIGYDYLIMATGIHTDFDGIKGLAEALKNDDKVCSIFSADYVKKVFSAIQNFKQGNAIFTFPKMPIKCPGAPQKIMYLAEEYFQNNGLRTKANVIYNTTLPVIFGVKKYADSLMQIVKDRHININFRTELVEIDHKNNLAIFEKLDTPGTYQKFNYSLLHVCPPMKPIEEVKNSSLSNETGYVDINKETMQHLKYSNVFGIGDCTTMPGKTMAAAAAESKIVYENLSNLIDGKLVEAKYDGYTSCPLITGKGKLILAEFDGNTATPMETFPWDQAKESKFMYHLKKDIMPRLYWNFMLKGHWNGPEQIRKFFKKIFFFRYK